MTTTEPKTAATIRNLEFALPVRPNAAPVVVLREKELDCDLATAIERVRGETAGSRSGILIIGPECDARAVVDGAEVAGATESGSLGADGLRRLGARVLALLEGQERLHVELQAVLEEMDDAAPNGSRAQIQGQVRTLREILEWSWAVHEDLVLEGRRAKAGQAPLDLLWLVRRVADEFATREEVPVVVAEDTRKPCWGDVQSLERLIRLALEVVSLRCGGSGPIRIELAEVEGRPGLRIRGTGEAQTFAAPKLVESFRTVAEVVGASVEPDPLGPGAPGMVLRLPLVTD